MSGVRLAESLSSPDYVRTSLAAAVALGFRPGRFYRDAAPRCVNLLLTYPDGCLANCAYCGLARSRPGDYAGKSFIRVEWPTLCTDEVVERVRKYDGEFARVCVAMVTHRRSYRDLLDVVRRVRAASSLPVSALVTPTLLNGQRLARLKESGADMVGVGLDAASERVFERSRGRRVRGPHSWHRYWRGLEQARAIFGPFKVSAHLIVGIGETDRELLETCVRLRDMEVYAHLFSFYPEGESAMARRRRPALVRWRRLQLVKFLLDGRRIRLDQLVLDRRGRLQRLVADPATVDEATSSGAPFVTGGCLGLNGGLACTRPFGSYRPGESFRDFPFWPTADDIRGARRELRLVGFL